MENAEHTINILNRLKQIGVQLSIDDFGTGYSSLSHLHRLPFDTLKIDRSFVCRVGEHGEDSEVLQTVISLAKNLKMRVIAEGIETPHSSSPSKPWLRLWPGLPARQAQAAERRKSFFIRTPRIGSPRIPPLNLLPKSSRRRLQPKA